MPLGKRRIYCVKSVLTLIFSVSYFSAFAVNTERYSTSLRIQLECGKIRNKIFGESIHQVSYRPLIGMLHSKNISVVKLTVSMKEPQELFTLRVFLFVYLFYLFKSLFTVGIQK